MMFTWMLAPSLASTYKVKYNSTNKRVLVGINTFASSGVTTTTNTFTITDHGYASGDKIIHSAATPCQGLSNDKIYYIVRVDDNNFKLSNTYHDATSLKPIIVDVQSTSSGEFGLINPQFLHTEVLVSCLMYLTLPCHMLNKMHHILHLD